MLTAAQCENTTSKIERLKKMFINNFKTITKLFLVLFFATLLNACGGGGAGSSIAPSEPEIPDDRRSLGNTSLEIYPEWDGTTLRIDHNALNYEYSQGYTSSSKVNDTGQKFIIFADGGDGVLNGTGRPFGFLNSTGRPSYYWEIVNGSSADESPTFNQYTLAADRTGTVAIVSDTSLYGDEKLTSGAAITVKLDSTTNITANVADNEIRFSNITLNLDAYSYDVWKDTNVCNSGNMINCQVSVANVASYAHFIRAEYAAIYFYHYDSYEIRTNDESLRGGRHYGVLTKYEDIPTTGSVSYNLHSIGRYTDYNDHSNDKILFGTGSMSADFSNDAFKLNLEVDDHNGDIFLDITNVQLNLSEKRNQIHSHDCSINPVLGPLCAGNFDYADDAVFEDVKFDSSHLVLGEDLQIGASFYGPNGEEIAGVIHHGTPSKETDADDDLSMAFIGKQ